MSTLNAMLSCNLTIKLHYYLYGTSLAVSAPWIQGRTDNGRSHVLHSLIACCGPTMSTLNAATQRTAKCQTSKTRRLIVCCLCLSSVEQKSRRLRCVLRLRYLLSDSSCCCCGWEDIYCCWKAIAEYFSWRHRRERTLHEAKLCFMFHNLLD